MKRRVEITVGSITAFAALADDPVARAIWDALPLEARAHRWGEEIYFAIPVAAEPSELREVVEAGDLGYWPPGRAFCLFWGPTPASEGDEIRPASGVAVFGRLEGEPNVFHSAPEGAPVRVTRAE